MSLLSLKNVLYDYGDNNLLKHINLNIEKHHKLGLIGRNGSGKTTLFKIINGDLQPLSGDITKISNISIAYLTQELTISSSKTLFQYVLSSHTEYLNLLKAIKTAEEKLQYDHTEQNLNKLNTLHAEFDAINGYQIETDIKIVLTALDFAESSWNQKVSLFSGGERTRIQLASVLLKPFDLLLLDEPTNHLDLTMIMWLENYLTALNKPYIIISHDRHFLKKTVTGILELRGNTLYHYNLGFTEYQKTREDQIATQYKEYQRQQEFIKKNEDFIRRNMAGQKVQQAKSRLKMLNKLETIDKPETEKKLRLNIETDNRTGNDVLGLKSLSIGYPNKLLSENINMNVHYQDKIAILGKNGTGKSTLLKVITGELNALQGSVKFGARIKLGYYDQMHIELDDSLNVKDTIWQLVPTEPVGYVLSYLARFGFRDDDVDKPVSILSGGEKSRLYLAKLIHQKPNLLILDEPTNHLDINMIDSLESALKNYDGTIIFVSHDRYFIERIATRKWAFVKNSLVEKYSSLEAILNEDSRKEEKIKKIDNRKKSKKVNPILLEKKLAEIDQLQGLEQQKNQRIDTIHTELSNKDVYSNPLNVKELQSELNKLEQEISEIKESIDILEMEYLEMLEDEE